LNGASLTVLADAHPGSWPVPTWPAPRRDGFSIKKMTQRGRDCRDQRIAGGASRPASP
jgi:hypothetical protein